MSPFARKGRSRFRCGETNGSPPRPGTRVKCVETTQPPAARTARTSGATRGGMAAISGTPSPARP